MKNKKNPDGTDMLDENGNPIPEETNPEIVSESELKKLTDTNKNLVEELKEIRTINAAFKAELDKKNEQPVIPPVVDPQKEVIKSVLAEMLQADRSSTAQANKTAALERFVTEHMEFHPDNDIGGLKKSALISKFNVFNTSGLFSVDEFLPVINDAYRLLVGNDAQPESSKVQNPYSQTPTPSMAPVKRENEDLSPKELKLIQERGMTKEAYLKLKKNHAGMIEDLLRYIRV